MGTHRTRLGRWLAALLVALLCVSACDREPPPPVPAASQTGSTTEAPSKSAEVAEPETAFRDPFLWKVTRADVDSPSYLFGTLHGGFEVHWDTLPADVRDAFTRSELIVLETDVSSAPQSEYVARMMLPEGESLRLQIGEERFERLVELTGQPAAIVDRFKPWIAESSVVRDWVGDDTALDLRLQTFARARDKELAYLETPIEQIELLDDAVTVEMLEQLLDDPERERAALKKAVEAYRAGDEVALREAVIRPKDLEANPQFYELMFTRRNENWLGKLEEDFTAGPTFVAVGAGHLIGPDNLVELLEKKGWKVER